MEVIDRISERLRSLTGRRPASNTASRTGRGTVSDREEIGYGGTRMSAGIVQEEHLAELRGTLGYQMAAKMRRTDGQVRATEKVVALPIRATKWLIEEPRQAGSAEKEATELLRENLMGGMETSWDDLIREACLAPYYGVRIPEIVWEEKQGMVAVRKIASRNLELLERWLYYPDGDLAGYLYAGNKPVGSGLRDAGGEVSQYTRVVMPLEKTIHLAFDQEHENPAGFGLWRSMYPHYYIKQTLYKIVGVGIDRNYLDVPVGKLQPGAQKKDRDSFLTQLRRWRAGQDAAVVLYDGQSVEFVGGTRSLLDAMPVISHHDAKMGQVALAQFLNLGQSTTGTQALATEHVRIFELAEDAIAGWIAEQLGRQLVRRWCLLNYGPGLRCPVVMHKPVKSRDLTAWANVLNQLAGGGFLAPYADDEDIIRDMMDLPPIPEDQKATRAKAMEEAGKAGKNEEPGSGTADDSDEEEQDATD